MVSVQLDYSMNLSLRDVKRPFRIEGELIVPQTEWAYL